MKIEHVLILWVLSMFPARWLIVASGIPEPIGVILFVVAIALSQMWLLNRVRCQNCGQLLCQKSLSLEGFVFWQRYLYFRGRCPHCDLARDRWFR
ncbi:MAG: hypothetical protein AB8B87_24210 [Granulosicoccus sp.]